LSFPPHHAPNPTSVLKPALWLYLFKGSSGCRT